MHQPAATTEFTWLNLGLGDLKLIMALAKGYRKGDGPSRITIHSASLAFYCDDDFEHVDHVYTDVMVEMGHDQVTLNAGHVEHYDDPNGALGKDHTVTLVELNREIFEREMDL